MSRPQPPPPSELPSPQALVKATLIATAVATFLLVVAVLPGEYGIDPTGLGRTVGLTQMGEVKAAALHAETADAEGMTRAADLLATADAQSRADTVRVDLAPGEGREVKLVMRRGDTAEFRWSTDRGVVGHELHGDEVGGGGGYRSYRKGAGAWSDQGQLVAAFDGRHGWYWENQTQAPLTVSLVTSGAYLGVE
jgi:hypothetical protein